MGASRTVVREALMLLEEDGLVVTRRGVGRFVADQLPETGLEELRPFEEVLATQRTAMTVRVGELVLQAATPYTAGHLGIDEAANTWFCESVVESGGASRRHRPGASARREVSQRCEPTGGLESRTSPCRSGHDPRGAHRALRSDLQLRHLRGDGECGRGVAGPAAEPRGHSASADPDADRSRGYARGVRRQVHHLLRGGTPQDLPVGFTGIAVLPATAHPPS
ncbi:GntR family transcriptional regulator [Tessaracoccus sp. G1721]